MTPQAPQPTPGALHVPDGDLDDLRQRLARTRFPDEAPGEPWVYGTSVAYMEELVRYWSEGFDWRAQEASLNALPHYRVPLHGIDLHFLTSWGWAPTRARCSCRTAGRARCSSSSTSSRV
jgi:Epoxide hydrolase N terminus